VLGNLAVGSIGCFGAPVDGEAEVGFGLVPDARGQGVAGEALRGLLAATDALGVRVRASVAPDNAPSLRLLARCGFSELRGSTEAGELVMVRPLPAG
jgi:RimJ/RimL family protein N-acetyltransferase